MTGLVTALDQLTGLGAGLLWTSLLVFFRVGAIMALLPAFGEQSVPVRVRFALTVAFTAATAPGIPSPPLPEVGDALQSMLVEIAAGLLMGFALRLFIMALQIAGAIAAQATSLSQLFAGAGAEPQPAIAHILVVAGLALCVNAGLHVQVARTLILSYEVVPPGVLPGSARMAEWGLAGISRSFALGFSLAAPFTAASLIYNLALGVINRAMPQLMVALVGAPALTLGALALLALAAPLALSIWLGALQGHFADPFGMPR